MTTAAPPPATEPATPDAASITPRRYLVAIVLSAAIGIPAAAVAAVFLALVHEAVHLLWTDLPDALGHDAPPWYLVIGLPAVGAVVVWAARRFLPGDGGHDPIHGLSAEPTPWRYAPGVALAAFGSLAFGAVVGPEAPLIALGSAIGLLATRLARFTGPEQRVVATAGSFSAISALFGGPLIAGMLLVEAGLGVGAMLIPVLIPGLVAAAVGYLLFVGLGDWGGIDSFTLTVPGLPAYDGTHVVDLLLAVVVGVVCAGVVDQCQQVAKRVNARVGSGGRLLASLVAGGLLVGVLAQVAVAFGASYDEILFSGQAAVPEVVAEGGIGLLLVIVAAKAIAYAVSLGCGFRGGAVFPAIFLGIGIATIAVVLFDVSPTWAVAVGTAAGTVSGTGLIFTSVLFSALLVGSSNVDTMPAAVFAAVAAWLAKSAIDRREGPLT